VFTSFVTCAFNIYYRGYKLMGITWEKEHGTHMEGIRKAYRILIGEPEGKESIVRLR
jgi:hypothetical protein